MVQVQSFALTKLALEAAQGVAVCVCICCISCTWVCKIFYLSARASSFIVHIALDLVVWLCIAFNKPTSAVRAWLLASAIDCNNQVLR